MDAFYAWDHMLLSLHKMQGGAGESELREAYPGMSLIMVLAQMYALWPGIDSDIEKTACSSCREFQENHVVPLGYTSTLVAYSPVDKTPQ